MAEIAEDEDGAERGDQESKETQAMSAHRVEQADPGRRGERREASATARLVAGQEERDVLDGEEEQPDLHALGSGQRRQVTIDVVGQLRVDAGDGEASAPRKQDLAHGVDEGGLAAMQHGESGGAGG